MIASWLQIHTLCLGLRAVFVAIGTCGRGCVTFFSRGDAAFALVQVKPVPRKPGCRMFAAPPLSWPPSGAILMCADSILLVKHLLTYTLLVQRAGILLFHAAARNRRGQHPVSASPRSLLFSLLTFSPPQLPHPSHC